MQFGVYGAAIGNVIGTVLATIVWYIVLRRNIGVRYINIGKFVVATYKDLYAKLVVLVKLRKAGA